MREAEHAEGIFLEPGLIANSMMLLKDFAKCGRGLTFLPEFLAQPQLNEGKLIAIPIDNPGDELDAHQPDHAHRPAAAERRLSADAADRGASEEPDRARLRTR